MHWDLRPLGNRALSRSKPRGKSVRTSPHSPVTQRGGGQRRRLHLMLVGGLEPSGHWEVGSVVLWSPLLQSTMRWRKPGPQLGVHCREETGSHKTRGEEQGQAASALPTRAPVSPIS